jgi:hypothetical protein
MCTSSMVLMVSPVFQLHGLARLTVFNRIPNPGHLCNGGARERDILARAYLRLIKHVNSIYKVCSSLLPSKSFTLAFLGSI